MEKKTMNVLENGGWIQSQRAECVPCDIGYIMFEILKGTSKNKMCLWNTNALATDNSFSKTVTFIFDLDFCTKKGFYPKAYILICVKYESCITYHSKPMANVKDFVDKQTDGPKTLCPRSIDASIKIFE